ncbi:hypothetical protein evm_014411 [Chilo suppressalis]|nr:hypothetical protein evm_014411 [Chilo suppressalis]
MYTPAHEYDKDGRLSSCSKSAKALTKAIFRNARDFCLETNMHGFNHIALPRRHSLERLLWVAATVSAIWCAAHLWMDQWQRYQDNPTVITLEKDYRSWLINLPGVTFCYNVSPGRVTISHCHHPEEGLPVVADQPAWRHFLL